LGVAGAALAAERRRPIVFEKLSCRDRARALAKDITQSGAAPAGL